MIFNPILILGTRGNAWMGYKAKNKRSKPYNMSLNSKYKMQEKENGQSNRKS